ncbi:MAG: nucleic acid binding, OB-fold, tRNA/helicase-type [Bryobacterales bacterium]|nr:nucleic acid binding, OB-fold, tRNA/helicase-type [Bryobacterales bacterium]
MRRKPIFWLSALLGMLLLSSCASTRIGRINADPSRYQNRVVHVEGRVTNSFGALGTGGYQLDDGSGRIYVISNRGVPSRGSKVAVSGRVMSGVTVMGQSFGTTIEEHGHRVRGY